MKRFLPPLLAVILSLVLALPAAGVSVSAEGAVLLEASTGRVLFEKSSQKRMPMASTTKIMTALVALEADTPCRSIVIPEAAVGIEGSSVYLKAGETLTMEDLLYAVLLESANDAATAVALAVGGTLEHFAALMNEKAAAIGLSDTHFTNPHGLDDENHYTTALDLARLSAAALRNPAFAKIVATKKKMIPLNGGEGVRVLLNHNKMLRLYDGAVGVKTGFTRHSGRCLVSAATRDGLTLIAVTLAAPNDWQDHTVMLDHGFSVYTSVSLAEPGEFSTRLSLTGGETQEATASVREALCAALPVGHGPILCRTEAAPFFFAPLAQDQPVGCVVFSCDGCEIGRAPLYSDQTVRQRPVKRSFLGKLFGRS